MEYEIDILSLSSFFVGRDGEAWSIRVVHYFAANFCIEQGIQVGHHILDMSIFRKQNDNMLFVK